MEKANYKLYALRKFLLKSFLIAGVSLYLIPAYAHHGGLDPEIYSITPQFIQQGQITTSVVSGENLNSAVIGLTVDGVYGVVVKQDPSGNNLTVQFAAQPTAPLGEGKFFVRNTEGESSFPIQIVPSGAPTIDFIDPDSGSPGATLLLRVIGMGLTNPLVTTPSDQFLINSYRASSDGSTLYLSVSLTPNITPGVYSIYINTIGGQAQKEFVITEAPQSTDSLTDLSIYSVESDPQSKNQIILKGSMFDPDPNKNTVTLLENSNGTTTGRQVEIVYSNNNEIVVNLPKDINSNSISFAVSSSEGKSSNIKTVDLGSLNNNQPDAATSTSPDSTTATSSSHEPNINVIGTPATIAIVANNTNLGSSHHKPTENSHQEGSKETSNEKAPDKQEKASNEQPATEANEETIVNKNIQTLSQYLFTTSPLEIKKESSTPSPDEIKDPAKLISALEENKQIKSQVDLIMIALEEAKENKDLSESLKKTEVLKSKVEELEKLLSTEKQKNKPDFRKLAKYQQLLANANAESKSQTFALLSNLLRYKPQLKNLLTQKPLDLATIQPNIPNNSVILQYVPTEEGLIIFIVDNNNLKTRINKNISKDILNREVQAYRQLFEKEIEKIKLTGRVTPILSWKNDKSKTYKNEILPLKEKTIFLYNALIEPVEKDIANKKVVAIIANGWLRYLPFQSLGKLQKDGEIQFLIDDKSIVYLDSVIAISKNLPASSLSMANITVFANPDGTLNGANKEAEIISMLFGKTVTSLIQKPFNISLINQLTKKADILHLATHGYLDSVDIESSYLVSGKKEFSNKFIQERLLLKDIYDLNLHNNKLVVLSGCDTGKLGNLLNEPDDIVGSLASAFRVAGSNTILASLWKAHDEATKMIMQSFYENLKLGLDKAEALRRAELKLKSNPQYGHPLFWSLFNLIGDWR